MSEKGLRWMFSYWALCAVALAVALGAAYVTPWLVVVAVFAALSALVYFVGSIGDTR
jgi:hypothetical protein